MADTSTSVQASRTRLCDVPSVTVQVNKVEYPNVSTGRKTYSRYAAEKRVRLQQVPCDDGNLCEAKTRKTKAEYLREYQIRKDFVKAEHEKEWPNSSNVDSSPIPYPSACNESSTTGDPSISTGSSTSNVVSASDPQKRRKSAAQYQRDYKARKKMKQDSSSCNSTTTDLSAIISTSNNIDLSAINNPLTRVCSTANLDQFTGGVAANVPCKRKSVQEFQREYREHLKSRLDSESHAPSLDIKKVKNNCENRTIGDIDTENIRNILRVPYTIFHLNENAFDDFRKKNTDDRFGLTCMICDQLHHKQDLVQLSPVIDQRILDRILPDVAIKSIMSCSTCLRSLRENASTVSTDQQKLTIYLNSLASARGLTICESQEGTFNGVDYYYERFQSQQLAYVALFQAISVESLYIIPVNKQMKFFHEYRNNHRSSVALRNEMSSLRQSPRKLLEQDLYHFMCSRQRNLSVIAFNSQSLRTHSKNLTDKVIKHLNIFMLSETFMDDNETVISAPNFDFMVRFQRNGRRNSGVAIYQNQRNQYHIVSPHLEVKTPYSNDADVTVSTSARIGDICAVQCYITNSAGHRQKLILIAVYISPNTAMRDIKLFLGKSLLPLSKAGSEALADIIGEPVNDYDQPVILAGDFNINFSLPEAQPLLEFLKKKFSFDMINGRDDPTSRRTTIDAVFARNLDRIKFNNFISYFSYHNPIVNIINSNFPVITDDTKS